MHMSSLESQEHEFKDLLLDLFKHDPRKDDKFKDKNLHKLIEFSVSTFPSLKDDLVLLLKTKILLYTLPVFSENESNNQAKYKIQKYLSSIGFDQDLSANSELLKVLTEFKNNLLHSSKSSKKSGWNAINPLIRDRLLKKQNNRCTICGIPLKIGSSKVGNSPEIDHIIPWALGGDKEENLRITCKTCNNYKSNNYWTTNVDFVYLNYFLKEKNLSFHHLILWSLERDHSKCSQKGCSSSSKNSKMYVSKLNPMGRLVYDNLSSFCFKCSSNHKETFFIHDESSFPHQKITDHSNM
jgi:hypothetical protein